jgi:Ni/Co efflux regulator RcnB
MLYAAYKEINSSGGFQMKKIISTIVAALVAVSFAGIVFAQEAPAPAAAPAAPAAPAAGEMKKEEAKPMKKHRKHKKHHKKHKKEEAGPAAEEKAIK